MIRCQGRPARRPARSHARGRCQSLRRRADAGRGAGYGPRAGRDRAGRRTAVRPLERRGQAFTQRRDERVRQRSAVRCRLGAASAGPGESAGLSERGDCTGVGGQERYTPEAVRCRHRRVIPTLTSPRVARAIGKETTRDRQRAGRRDACVGDGAGWQPCAGRPRRKQFCAERLGELGARLPSRKEIVDVAEGKVREAAGRLQAASGIRTGREPDRDPQG